MNFGEKFDEDYADFRRTLLFPKAVEMLDFVLADILRNHIFQKQYLPALRTVAASEERKRALRLLSQKFQQMHVLRLRIFAQFFLAAFERLKNFADN